MTLPAHLLPYWGRRTDDPRKAPNYCARQSRRTPAIPWHNLVLIGAGGHGWQCIACDKVTA